MKRNSLTARWCVLFGCVLALASTCVVGSVRGSSASQLVTEGQAARHGLTRSWFGQAQVNSLRDRVEYTLLNDGTFFIQTKRSALHAIDAETGQSLWAVQVGSKDLLSQQPSANSKVVATINGTTLYIYNRFTGKLLLCRRLSCAVGAGCELSEFYAYVSSINNKVTAYRIDQEAPQQLLAPPSGEDKQQHDIDTFRLSQGYIEELVCQADGHCLIQPVIARQNAAEECLSWVSDLGYMYLGYINKTEEPRLEMRHRVGVTPKTVFFDKSHLVGQDLRSASNIACCPTYLQADPKKPGTPSIIFIASTSGSVFAIDDVTGQVQWQFTTGELINQRLAAVSDTLYVPLQRGGMYALEAKTGIEKWLSPNVKRFVAASDKRLYAIDMQDRLVILSKQTGLQIDTIMNVGDFKDVYFNINNDRIYLTTETGMIQCLHESDQDTPISHRYPIEEMLAAAQPTAKPRQPGQQPNDPGMVDPDAGNPFGNAPAAGNGGTDDPFGAGSGSTDPFGSETSGAGAPDPFGESGGTDDPFGEDSSSDPFGESGGTGNPFGGDSNPF